MTQIKALLKSRRGASFPLIVAVTLSLLLIFAGISEYLRLLVIAQGVRDAMQAAAISAVTGNYDEVYHGVREGYSGGYLPDSGTFAEALDQGDIYAQLDRVLGLHVSGPFHEKQMEDGGAEFRIWDLEVSIRNAPIAEEDHENARFVIECVAMLEVPVSFGGKLLPPMQMDVCASAGYIPRF